MTASNTTFQPYPAAEPNPDFPRIEEEVQRIWKENAVFQQSVDFRPLEKDGKHNEFVFYDGPPFANGLPHYGHLVTGFVKDLVPRYQTMKGRKVERRFGWDCHGLPAELQSEKELGVSGRHDILKFGIDKFNAHCQVSVLRFTQEWEYYVTRQGRWVDFQNDYKTMDITFMESVMWAFKQLWDKGLVYEGYRVVPYSWAVESPLSNFETRLDNSYRERQDPALTVRFRLDARDGDAGPLDILAWTTTPWTLPSNLALAVGPEIEYAVMRKGDDRLILATSAIGKYAKELDGYEQESTLTAEDLRGRTYEPIFPYFKGLDKAHQILVADFVTTGDGVGIVHMAPGFGEDDLAVCKANGLPVKVPVDVAGNFTSEVSDYAGLNVIEANKPIIQDLKARGVVLRHETYLHNYPHCWRTDTPLIYKAVNSWYVEVSKFKDRMVELNQQQINWVPGHVKDGSFGNWLANARDWNISRNRFWGSPIPVWRSDDPRYPRIDVYGSIAELERDFGVKVTDLHRPAIDHLTRPNPDDPTGQSMMRRVEDVLDCWFESGSMPFAQQHYPFENKERFEAAFPADFIVEYVAQTRGWFYTLMVLSTALFDCAPFKNVICHGVVLDEDKQKLSKRLRNYPDPVEVLNNQGADALRWYLVSSPLMVGGDLAMPKDARGIAQALRQGVLPLWNAYSFFTLYANIDQVKGTIRADQKGLLDRYILAKTRELVEGIEAKLDGYDLPGAYAIITGYYDALNNWFIRRSRSRFWREAGEGDGQDKVDAYDTLYTCLVTATKALAPLLPHVTERIYTALTGEASVHLADWPDVSYLPSDHDLTSQIDLVREICASAMSLREAKKLRIRLPLRTLTIVHPDADRLKGQFDTVLGALVADEVNVKQVIVSSDISLVGTRQLAVNAAIVGPKVGPKMKEVMAASKTGKWTDKGDGTVELAGVVLEAGDFDIRIQAKEGTHASRFAGGKGVVVLDVTVDAELEAEGWARDFVRAVQSTRKDNGFQVTDRITIQAWVPDTIAGALTTHAETIKRETLALSLTVNPATLGEGAVSVDLSGTSVSLLLKKVGRDEEV